jgi:hypothetical protein
MSDIGPMAFRFCSMEGRCCGLQASEMSRISFPLLTDCSLALLLRWPRVRLGVVYSTSTLVIMQLGT